MTLRNIFLVDIESIRQILKEANAPLAKRSDELVAALDRVPTALKTDDEVRRAINYSRMLKNQIRECREARLSDQKSFKEAVKTVEEYFADFENPLKRAFEKVTKIVAKSQAANWPSSSASASSVPVVKSDSGLTVAASASNSSEAVPLEWAVVAIDRQRVELEALRPYLTEYVLKQAATRHLAEHGPNKLAGVTYEQRAAL